MQNEAKRVRRALDHGRILWVRFAHERSDAMAAMRFDDSIRPEHRVYEELDIVVTELGFVTMAVLPHHGTVVDDHLVVPGADDRGARGFLVLRSGMRPFHSLKSSAHAAVDEAKTCRQQSDAIEAALGGKAALKQAVAQVPWYQLSRTADLDASGLCVWGAESFLRRRWLLKIVRSWITRRIGIPRLLFRAAGAYGERVTASTLVRKAHAAQAGRMKPRFTVE